MVRTIEEIHVEDVEKRKFPSKHYVYVIHVTWSDGSTNVIYRRYSRLFDFQSNLMEMFPEEAGSVDPSKRIIPFLPGKKFFGRSHIREVAVRRLGPIAEYCKQFVKLPRRISQCKEVVEFFEMDPDDMNPQKGKKASMKAKKISTPKPLEVYVACTEYKKQEKGEVTLTVGMMVEVVEKTETGWWFVNADEEQGWVPSTCLQRDDGEKEETAVRFKPGQEEQYLCTEEFIPEGEDELSMERGAVVDVIEKNLEGWWFVRYNGKEGYVPATYLMKTEAFQVRKRPEPARTKPNLSRPKQDLTQSTGGPQIIKSMSEVSDLLKEDKLTPVSINIDDDDDDTYTVPAEEEEEEIYTIHEISKILKENKQGDSETEKINKGIRNAKSRSLTRGGSIRPPPRPSIKPKFGQKSPVVTRPVVARMESLSMEYVTIAAFDDAVGDGISFTAGQQVKVMEKSEGGWWFIQIDGQEGWAPASYIQKASEQTTSHEVTEVTRPLPPPPVSQANKSQSHSSSREDLTKDDQKESSSPRRISAAMEGLKDALKAKLPHKAKTPPTPPKKDFLRDEEVDDDDDDTDEWDDDDDDDDEFEETKSADTHEIRHSTTKSAVRKSGSHGFHLPVKPGAPHKSASRNKLHPPPPPPPPPQASKHVSKPEGKTDTRPKPPVKVKSDTAQVSKVVTRSDEQEQNGTVNFAGLAGALKAKFDQKTADRPEMAVPPSTAKPKNLPQKPTQPSLTQKPSPPSFTQKPTQPSVTQKPTPSGLAQKPTPPNLSRKPKPDAKPVPPSMAQKPTLDPKPAPPTASHKPKVDGIKPVLNKVEFPNTYIDGPKSPGKPFTNKPPPVNAAKPAWAKHDTENVTKPSWAKHDNDNSIKPASEKPEIDTNKKPAWAKQGDNTSKPAWAKHDDNTSKPAWAKPDGNTSKPVWAKPDDKTSKPAWAKPDDNTSKPAWAKPDDKTSKPAWAKPNDKNSKPAWAKPDNDINKKPPWAKHDIHSNSDHSHSSGVEVGATKVSDLASVLKSKLENKSHSDTETHSGAVTSVNHQKEGPPPLPNSDNKPVTGLKPKPFRPAIPPIARPGNPSAGSRKLDPSKYSARPLPPMPRKPEDKTSSSDPNTSKKPLPTLPVKPTGGISRTDDKQASSENNSDSDDDVKPMGVSGLANALKAKLAQKTPFSNASASTTSESAKPLPSVPAKNTTDNSVNSNHDIQNNNKETAKTILNAIADYGADNDGEISLVIGQQYELLEKADGWWFVSSGSHEGWAPADYLEYSRDPNQSSAPRTVQGGNRPKQSVFRTCSDFSAENEGEVSVPRGQEISVLERPEGGWWFVEFNGNEGWVPESYLEQV